MFRRNFLAVIAMAHLSIGFGNVYYVATQGSDSNKGSATEPFATVQRAQDAVVPGDTVYIRGGVYHMREDQIASKERMFACVTDIRNSGEPGKRINYWAYPGETPVFDYAQVKPENCRVIAFFVSASWIHLKGLEVVGVQVTIKTHTQSECFENQGSNNIYEMLKMHDGMAIGIYCNHGSDNLFLNCDAYRNYDSFSEGGRGGNTDGFGCHVPMGNKGNIFRGCRSWFNSDDGYDCIASGETTTFDHCWAFFNGYSPAFKSLGDGNGFKAGGYGKKTLDKIPNPIPHNVIQFCLAVHNKAHGFYSNHHIAGSFWYNNSAYANSVNFDMLNRLPDNLTDVPGYGHVLKNNLGYKGIRETESIDLTKCEHSHNYFDLSVRVSDEDFQSLDESLLMAPRQSDGSLPNIPFMKLRANSALIDKGVDIGFPLKGAAPDLGAYEY